MPETVLRFDADVSQITVKFKKVGEEAKKAGENAAKGFDWLGGLDKKLEAIPKKLMTVMALLTGIGTAAKIANDVAMKQAGMAGDTNTRNMAASQAAMRMGGNIDANMKFINSTSPMTTMEGRMQFAQSIATLQEERRAQGLPGIPEAQVQRLSGMYARGGEQLFGTGGSDITSALRQHPYYPDLPLGRQLAGRQGIPYTGQPVDGLIDSGLQGIPQSALLGMGQQYLRDSNVNVERYEAGRSGSAQQAYYNETMRQSAEIQHPYASAIADEAAGIPILGDMGKYLKRKVTADGRDMLSDILKEMKRGNAQAGPVLPNLNARGESSQGAP